MNSELYDRFLRERDSFPEIVGKLEVMPEGFGFLASTAGPIFVGPNLIRRHELKSGDEVRGKFRKAKEGERFDGLLRVLAVNGRPLDSAPGFPYPESL